MLAARSRKIRSVLHEQNALAGRVTKLADRIRVPIASGWDECEGLEPGHYAKVGVPIRRFRAMSRQEAHSILGTGGDGIGPVASVMTGSLGSGSLSEVLAELAKMEVFLTWTFFAIDPRVDAPQRAGANVTRLPKMWDISPVYAVSDILVTRCGASTLAEIEALGIPAVAVPWRGAADDHQMKNARLAAASEKILIWDELNDTLADLAEKIQNLYAVYCDSKSSKGNMLYNAGETCEKNCRLLWDFADSFRKGEVELEGRSLH
jgi:UDP-N-acetylglucosamine--N-acetylmuramyl-(pentapeptide) pyrophosphoryl-undecaprenol N-acetylglucosamine transferase